MKLTIILLISLPLIWASSNASPSLKSRSDLDLDRQYGGHYYNGYYYPRSPDYYGYQVTYLLQWFLNEWYPRVTDAVPRLDTYNLEGLTRSLDTLGDFFTNTTQKLQQLTSLMQQYQACMGQARSANHEEELEDDRHYYNYYGGSYSLADWQRRTLASRDALVADMAGTYRSCTPLQSSPDPILVQACNTPAAKYSRKSLERTGHSDPTDATATPELSIPDNPGYSRTNYATTADYPSTNHATANYPSTNHATANYPSTNYARGDYPSTNHATANYPSTNHARGDYPSTNYATADYPSTNHATANYPSTNHAGGDYPSSNYARGDYPNTNYARGDYPNTNYARGDYP
ncbi:unnamed protein product, partial [Cyprideis torosa]